MRYSIWAGIVAFAMATSVYAGTISGKIPGGKGVSVVYVDTIMGKSFPAPARNAVMNQVGMRFVPHILVVQQGTNVDFLNSDNTNHNVFLVSVGENRNQSHNLGTWPQGQMRRFKFDKPGTYQLHCWIHPDMSAYILVVPTPYFAIADKSGNYRIKNVPDGAYTISVWNEKATVWKDSGEKSYSRQVNVSEDTVAKVLPAK